MPLKGHAQCGAVLACRECLLQLDSDQAEGYAKRCRGRKRGAKKFLLASAGVQKEAFGRHSGPLHTTVGRLTKAVNPVQLDEIEAEERAERRRVQIEAANKMLYEDADKAKAFRSKLLLSDVMQEQAAQREYAAQIKALRRQQDEEFLKQMWAGLKVGGFSGQTLHVLCGQPGPSCEREGRKNGAPGPEFACQAELHVGTLGSPADVGRARGGRAAVWEGCSSG